MPARSPLPATPDLIIGRAADFDAAVEDAVGAVVVEEPFEDAMPSAEDSVGSAPYWAETPEELEQLEGGVPIPETNFTAIH
jgi:hypothetical protein